jgi:hypothetical protein
MIDTYTQSESSLRKFDTLASTTMACVMSLVTHASFPITTIIIPARASHSKLPPVPFLFPHKHPVEISFAAVTIFTAATSNATTNTAKTNTNPTPNTNTDPSPGQDVKTNENDSRTEAPPPRARPRTEPRHERQRRYQQMRRPSTPRLATSVEMQRALHWRGACSLEIQRAAGVTNHSQRARGP